MSITAIRPLVTFEIQAVEEGDMGYLEGYYSLVCSAIVGSLRGSYTVALVSAETREEFCTRSGFKTEMQDKALQQLISVVRNERLRLRV